MPRTQTSLASGVVLLALAGGVAWLALRDPALDWLEAREEAPDRIHRSPHVDDSAAVLGPFAPLLERMAAAFLEDLGVDVQIVTLRGVDEKIAPLAERIFRTRGVGERAPTGGVLIVLDADRGLARLEVSYTLEGVYTDLLTARLARDQLAPFASHRAAGMAVMDVVHHLRDVALDAAAAGEVTLAPELAARVKDELARRSGGGGAQVRIAHLAADAGKARVPDAERPRYAPASDPRESARAYQRVLRDGAGDPTLELFTPASRVMRARHPVAPYEDEERAAAMERAGHLELVVREGRAVLFAAQPPRGFVPVLLERSDGVWRVDLVETFKNFFFDRDGVFFMWNAANPYAFAFDARRSPRTEDLSPLPLYGQELSQAIAQLEQEGGAAARFRLAELLYRNCWTVIEALPRYEEAAQLAPHDWRVVATLADRASYVGFPELAIPYVKQLGPGAWTRVARLYAEARQPDRAKRYYRRALRFDPGSDEARRGLERVATIATGNGSGERR